MSKEMEPLDPEDIGESIGISPEEIEADMEYVRTTSEKIARQNELAKAIKEKRQELEGVETKEVLDYYERLGHVFEGFLYSHIGKSQIFRDVILNKTSEFDDLQNGVDFVAELHDVDNPKSYIALAMDASFSMSQALIEKKMDRSMKDIAGRKLSQVKYFQYEEGAPEAKIGMPRVVVGTDEYRVQSLLERWYTEEKSGSDISFEQDPVWTLMALEINEQLKMFIDQANFHKQTLLASVCGKYQKALEASLRLNKDLVEKHRLLSTQDGTANAIRNFCAKIERERGISKVQHSQAEQDRLDDEMFRKAVGR